MGIDWMQIEWTNTWLIAAEVAVALIIIVSVFFIPARTQEQNRRLARPLWAGIWPGGNDAWIEEQGRGQA